ncbi:AAA family ATPase [Streptococcus mitis]|uniref:AAA family ATPase n=1 Tax=Streptococcus mitis TaxID=28037 RepID=UPI001C1EAA8D|nr:AAA family ATPase [Streptococcus mitis]MBU6825813.1 AAA family ATPase [Streptococcus mitis]
MHEIIFPISSSFVIRELKEAGTSSSGDSKAFIKTIKSDEEIKEIDDFFNDFSDDNIYYFEKDNLLAYLNNVKLEYYLYKEKYNAINSDYYEKILSQLNLEASNINFTVERAPATSNGKINRYYLRLEKNNYIRVLGLPKLTVVTISKESQNKFLFTLDVDWDEICSQPNDFENNRFKQFVKYLYPNITSSERIAKTYANFLLNRNFKEIAQEIGYNGNTEIYCIKSIKLLNSVIDNITTLPNFASFNTRNEGKLKKALEHYWQFTNQKPKNLISYGAPGTGKSYAINKLVKQYYPNFEDDTHEDSKYVFRTTLHKEYMYSDFVGQILPKVNGTNVTYDFIPGIFTLALDEAYNVPDNNIYLILEELSRADVAAVFGDLFQLLDRKKDGESEYQISNPNISKYLNRNNTALTDDEKAKKKFSIPANLHIYCTVNTNDQNVFVMDTAFKRRFEWQYVSTEPAADEETGEELNNPILIIDNNEISWWEFYTKLNNYITSVLKLSEDKQIGQFFIQFTDNDNRNKDLIKNKLLQYLWEDVAKNAYSNESLFDNKITSFSQLYQKFEQGENVFIPNFFKQDVDTDIEIDGTEVAEDSGEN